MDVSILLHAAPAGQTEEVKISLRGRDERKEAEEKKAEEPMRLVCVCPHVLI